MPRGLKIQRFVKRGVALAYMEGKDMTVIAEESGLALDTVYRLRQRDREYQAIEAELEAEVVARFRLRLKRYIGNILQTMMLLTRMPTDNEVTHETFTRVDSAGRTYKVNKRTYKVDPKLVFIKYQASEKLLDAFLRVVEGEVGAQQGDQLLQQREALLSAYGITPPPAPARKAAPRRAAATEDAEDATALMVLPQTDASLRDLLAELLPEKREKKAG